MARILDSIDAPDKLKLLTDEELSILANEIREEIIQVTSKTGGPVSYTHLDVYKRQIMAYGKFKIYLMSLSINICKRGLLLNSIN